MGCSGGKLLNWPLDGMEATIVCRTFVIASTPLADFSYLGYDFAALTFLSHVPYHYFLASFYLIRPTTAIGCLAIDTMAVYLPFRLLKVSSSIHSIKTPKGVAANRIVINDFGVQVYASLFAAGIYGVIVSASYVTWLPVYLINHFDGIRDISIIHNRNFPWLMASYIPMGFAAKVFMFTPSTAAKPDAYDKEIAKFNPESATLSQTVIYNFWGFSKRTRTLIKRTATVVVVGGLHTWLQTYVSLEGAEAFGAAGWSSVWAIAATWVGVAFWWVADVEGMSN